MKFLASGHYRASPASSGSRLYAAAVPTVALWTPTDHRAAIAGTAGSTKNGEGRVFPFTTELLTKAGVITPHVFFYTAGKKAGKRITESGFNKAWRKARVEAGCPGRISHDFSRTAGRNLVRAGVPERVAMQLTGHKTRAVFER